MVPAAGVVAPALAAAEQDAGVADGRRLAHLDVKPISMQRHFARDGDYVECKKAFTPVFLFRRSRPECGRRVLPPCADHRLAWPSPPRRLRPLRALPLARTLSTF